MTSSTTSGILFLSMLALLNIGTLAHNAQVRLAAGIALIALGIACLEPL